MAKSKRTAEVDRADREPGREPVRAARTPARGAAPGPRATPSAGQSAEPKSRPATAERNDAQSAPTRRAEPQPGAARAATNSDSGANGRATSGRDKGGDTPRALAAAEAVRMERADIGLTDEQRAGVSRILNKALSDEHVLYIRTRNYHWNVTGMHFKSLHEFFEEQYKALETAIDEIAERTRSLGFRAIGSMSEFLAHARLPEHNPAEVPDAVQMLRNLLENHEAIIRHLRTDIDACDEQFEDVGTADFLTAMMEAHEKMAWMIRAYLS